MTNQFKVKSLILAMGVTFASVPVYAEEAEAEEEEAQTMVIVGSRAAPRSVGDSPVPVDVISDCIMFLGAPYSRISPVPSILYLKVFKTVTSQLPLDIFTTSKFWA